MTQPQLIRQTSTGTIFYNIQDFFRSGHTEEEVFCIAKILNLYKIGVLIVRKAILKQTTAALCSAIGRSELLVGQTTV